MKLQWQVLAALSGEFRSFWKPRLGGHKDLIDVWLDSRGGLPGAAEDGWKLEIANKGTYRAAVAQGVYRF